MYDISYMIYMRGALCGFIHILHIIIYMIYDIWYMRPVIGVGLMHPRRHARCALCFIYILYIIYMMYDICDRWSVLVVVLVWGVVVWAGCMHTCVSMCTAHQPKVTPPHVFIPTLTGEDTTTKQLRDDLMTMLIAGHETSAAVLTWTLFELSRRPEVCGYG